jgi:hypothetical protein
MLLWETNETGQDKSVDCNGGTTFSVTRGTLQAINVFTSLSRSSIWNWKQERETGKT